MSSTPIGLNRFGALNLARHISIMCGFTIWVTEDRHDHLDNARGHRHPQRDDSFEPELWLFQRLLDKTQPEDFVYLHYEYSGHGTQTPSDAPPGPHSTRELALVLFEFEKGLLVTLVLDRCFSGSVVHSGDRHGSGAQSTIRI
jgi:hypothetical protein